MVNDISTGSPWMSPYAYIMISLQSKLVQTIENRITNNDDFLSLSFQPYLARSYFVIGFLRFFISILWGPPSTAVG